MSKKNKIAALQQQANEALRRNALPQARAALESLCKLDKRNGQGWFLLGAVLGSLGEGKAAINASRKATELQPGNPDAHLNLAQGLAAEGHRDEAEKPARRALQLAPRNARGQLLLGDLLSEKGDAEGAATCYRTAGELDPQLGTMRADQAKTLADQGRLEQAVDGYHQALAIAPASAPERAEIRYLLSYLLTNHGRLDEAEEVVGAGDNHPYLAAARAHLLDRRGRFGEARDALRPALDHQERFTGVALTLARLCHRIDACAEAADYLEAVLKSPQGSGDRAVPLRFALARVYDRLGEYDRAFAAASEANQQKARTVGGYRPAEFEQRIDRLITATRPEQLARGPRGDDASDLPVFIVGTPRSGSSLTEQILAAHPELFGAGELSDIETLAREVGVVSCPENLTSLNADRLNRLAGGHLEKLRALAGDARRCSDKMPGNFLHLALIARLFPGARVIHTRRQPLDTAVSNLFQNFSANYAFGYDLVHFGHYYRQYQRLMEHWRTVEVAPIFDLEYERLAADGEPVIREMVDFLELPWDEDCLHFHNTERLVHTASYDQVRQPLHTGSVGRWRNYESHLGPLIDALGDTL